jgi:putative phosphoribosyl transferase
MYTDRIQAGLALAAALKKFKGTKAVILAVPRGGVPVAYVIAKQLNLPLDIVLIKKLGHPQHPEYAIGAVNISDRILVHHEGVSDEYIEEQTLRIRERLRQMYHRFRGNKPEVNITGKIALIVDDGIATGRTLASAVSLTRKSKPSEIVIAVPVASERAVKYLSAYADEIICPLVPEEFFGVGAFYEDFSQTTDEEVTEYLEQLQS